MRRSASMLVMLSLWGCNCDDPQFTQKRCEYRVTALSAPPGTATVDFQRVRVRTREETTIRIENVGNTALPQFEIQWRDGTGENVKAQFESLPVITEPIGTGAVVDVTVTYAPITAVSAGGQSHRGTVRFSHPDINEQVRCPPPQDVSLVGTSYEGQTQPPDAGVTDAGPSPDVRDTGFHDAGRPDYGPPVRPDGGFPFWSDGHFKAAYAGQQARAGGAAIQLDDGRMVLVGGVNRQGAADNTIEVFDPRSGAPTWHGPMATGRIHPALALLPDGTVLITGGLDNALADRASASTSIEIFNPDDGTIAPAGAMNIGRYGHTASRVGANVVILGGLTRTPGQAPGEPYSEEPAVAVELFSPGLGQVRSLEVTSAPRWFHTATVLPGDQVLLLGGMGDEGIRDDGEFFSGEALVPLQTTLGNPRLGHTATVVVEAGQTKVMIAGGHDGETVHSSVVWLTPTGVPGQGSLSEGTAMTAPRYGHNAVVLSDETILVMGGADRIYVPEEGPEAARQDAERWVGLLGQWLPLANRMSSRRYHAFAGRLGEDGAFVIGGSSMVGRPTAHTNAERFLLSNASFSSYGLLGPRHAKAASGQDMTFFGGIDLHTGRVSDRVRSLSTGFSDLPPMQVARADAAAVRLPGDDDTYLIIGGRDEQGQALRSVEIWNSEDGGRLTGSLNLARSDHAAYLLDSGDVVVAGGLTNQADPTDTLELYDPFTQEWTEVEQRMNTGRFRPSLSPLPDGRILLHGGTDPQRNAAPVDLFNPQDLSVATGNAPQNARRHHGHLGVRVGNADQVLFAGGEIWRGGYRAATDADLYVITSGAFAPINLAQSRRGPAVVPAGDDLVMIAGGNQETADIPGLPVKALYTVEMINLETLNSSMMEAEMSMPRAFPTPVIVGEGEQRSGYIAGGLVYDGVTADDQQIITPLTGLEYSAEGNPPTR
ncbi:MAG: kelch repeat-containing protein [Myxococcota bacterium]|nr:kelch repeat-containing protein [Myxococcota bacterium]